MQGLEEKIEGMSHRLSDEQAEAIYSMGYHLMQQGQGDRAARVLLLLTLFRPNDAKYWHAMGVCCHRRNDPAGAVEALTRALDLAPEDPKPAFLLVESLLALGLRDEATSLLDLV